MFLNQIQINFHFQNNNNTFAEFINILFVITKGGGNRPYETLATLLL